jgi:hypothetical protein
MQRSVQFFTFISAPSRSRFSLAGRRPVPLTPAKDFQVEQAFSLRAVIPSAALS